MEEEVNVNRQRVIGVIPARYSSSRFDGKVLAKIAGKPMIQWVYYHASQSDILDDLYIAVDDLRVQKCIENFGGKAVMTGLHHQSGTDRIAEVIKRISADIVVNIQGDMPLIDPKMIEEGVIPMLDNPDISMATLKMRIGEENYEDPSVVKVVVDEKGFALYFSRSVIPNPRDIKNVKIYEHIGLYFYRKDFLLKLSRLPQTYLEKIESLEQLRVLEKGYKILVLESKCEDVATRGFMVDTPQDLIKAEELMKKLYN